MPELSIIVPVYKVELYLRRCIDSILAQTFRDFELILIDDGSPDNCGAICDEYAAKDSRIIVIHQENQGVSAARNAGLDIACGTYLGFVDSDDWIEPEMYETMISTAEEKQVDVVVCGVAHYDDRGGYLFQELVEEGLFSGICLRGTIYDMPNRLGGGACNKIYRRSKVRNVRFRESISMAEDRMYLCDAFRSCEMAYKLPDILYAVVEHEQSATHQKNISVPYRLIISSYQLHEMVKKDCLELSRKSTDKFLDDCVRYIPRIKQMGKCNRQRYLMKLMHSRYLMTKMICKAYRKKLISTNKIRGYVYMLLKSFARV